MSKHIRTIHEAEEPRPAEPLFRANPHGKTQRLKLVMKDKSASAAADSEADGTPDAGAESPARRNGMADGSSLSPPSSPLDHSAPSTFPAGCEFDEDELALPVEQLYRLCRRQVRWSQQEGERLKAECDALERKRAEEWRKKELVLANLMEAELATAYSNPLSDATEKLKIEGMSKCEVIGVQVRSIDVVTGEGLLPKHPLPIPGPTPWFREQKG